VPEVHPVHENPYALAGALVFWLMLWAPSAAAQTSPPVAVPASPPRAIVDRAVVRFYAPEVGGTAQPRFVSERTLAFEARLEAIADRPDSAGEGYDERQVRAALDHHVTEEMLVSLAHKLIEGSLPGQRPSQADLAEVEQELSAALFDKLGGQARIEAAARAELLGASEVEAMLRRQALAAWYIHRAVTPILHPTDEQLRGVFRTAAHPYRGQSFEQARAGLRRWFVIERVRVTESAYLQAVRSRVRIVVTR
ncbi:MAG TPA: hypothetical protein VGY54_02090, partial [Polyangiaceae bacterium]|nr:hypothetical protein [Polyangiaceae bacterium]